MELQLLVAGIALLVILVPGIFYLLTIQRTLNVISPLSRTMRSQQVWLMLIPLFNIVWHFIMVNRLSNSIKNECARLNILLDEEKPAYMLGIGIMCLHFAGIIIQVFGIIPILQSVFNLASFVGWITYWLKINRYKDLMLANQDNLLLDAEREAAGVVS